MIVDNYLKVSAAGYPPVFFFFLVQPARQDLERAQRLAADIGGTLSVWRNYPGCRLPIVRGSYATADDYTEWRARRLFKGAA